MSADGNLLRLAHEEATRLLALVEACDIEALPEAFDAAAQAVRDENAYRVRAIWGG